MTHDCLLCNWVLSGSCFGLQISQQPHQGEEKVTWTLADLQIIDKELKMRLVSVSLCYHEGGKPDLFYVAIDYS